MRARYPIAMAAVAALLAPGTATAGGVSVTITSGHGYGHHQSYGYVHVGPPGDPPAAGAAHAPAAQGHRRGYHHRRLRRHLVAVAVPVSRYDPVAGAPAPDLAPKPAAAMPDPPAPPDPRGPLTYPVEPAHRDGLEIGHPVPPGLALVMLHGWRGYGMEPPPGGQAYARLGREILLITVQGRRVMRIVGEGAVPGNADD